MGLDEILPRPPSLFMKFEMVGSQSDAPAERWLKIAGFTISLKHCNRCRLRYAQPPLANEETQVTKNELIAAIADKTGKTRTDVSAVLASLAGVAAKSLKSGSDVTVGGLGKFSAAQREAREARNPSTGATIKVPAKTVVKFRVAKDLADAVA